jgi:aquaporin Z
MATLAEASAERESAVMALRAHWREYCVEAAALGMFMLSACVFGVLLEHPMSPANQALEDALGRRALMGLAMGLTAVAIIYSPFGQRSGAHMNPAVTLTFWMLGKIANWDAIFYVAFQFLGGALGVALAAALIGPPISHSAVRYVVTIPGEGGPAQAFGAEVLISAVLMTAVLVVSNTKSVARYTGLIAGALVASFITFEAPLSGMSMNPARTLGSAVSAWAFPSLWIYFTAPPLGMFLAAQLYKLRGGSDAVYCAKFHHPKHKRCIFRCRHAELEGGN